MFDFICRELEGISQRKMKTVEDINEEEEILWKKFRKYVYLRDGIGERELREVCFCWSLLWEQVGEFGKQIIKSLDIRLKVFFLERILKGLEQWNDGYVILDRLFLLLC